MLPAFWALPVSSGLSWSFRHFLAAPQPFVDSCVADRVLDRRKGHGRTGHAGTQFERHTPAQAKERDSFARQLADYLNEGVAAKRCNGLVLIASSPMLVNSGPV